MTTSYRYVSLNYLIAAVWLVNGLVCKVFNLVPRHQQIVAEIMGPEHAGFLTLAIGIAETGMALWIVLGHSRRLAAFVQIICIASMNILEFILVPELLLWGKANSIFAFLFIILVYYNGFYNWRKQEAFE